MINIAIIDDSKIDANRLSSLISVLPFQTSIKTYSNLDSFFEQSNFFDFLLLDINLENDDGIKNIDKCSHFCKYIIFITTEKSRMQDAFSQNVVGYFLKQEPDDNIIKRLTTILHRYSEKYITLKTDNSFQSFPISSIYRITRENRKIYVYFKNSSIRLYDTTIKEIYSLVKDNMFYIDRSILVNYSHIISFVDTTITFDNNATERVNPSRKKEALDKYINFSIQNY